MELTFTHFRVLYESLDGSSVPQLPLASKSYAARNKDIDWPPILLDEARHALLDLLRNGYVVLYDSSDSPLAVDDAARVIGNDDVWTYPIADPDHYEVSVTEEGERVYEMNRPRFRPHEAE